MDVGRISLAGPALLVGLETTYHLCCFKDFEPTLDVTFRLSFLAIAMCTDVHQWELETIRSNGKNMESI